MTECLFCGIAAGDIAALGVAAQAHRVAGAEGIDETCYRIVFDTGPEAGQPVPHAPARVLGGRALAWPPG